MKELGPATEHEMVLAFVKAEIDSPDFRRCWEDHFSHVTLDRKSLLEDADLKSPNDNQFRLELLKLCRGYTANRSLFAGFPSDVQWRRVKLEPSESSSLLYSRHSTWVTLSGGTRRVIDGATNVGKIEADGVDAKIRAIALTAQSTQEFGELIAVQGDGQDLVLVEGHHRATAYVLAKTPYPIKILVGTSSVMENWAYF